MGKWNLRCKGPMKLAQAFFPVRAIEQKLQWSFCRPTARVPHRWGRLRSFRVLALFLVGTAFGQRKGWRATGRGGLGLLSGWLLAGLAIGVLGRLLGLVLSLLRLLGHHDAEIMLRMLKIILGHHPVTARIGVAGQLQILFIDMAGGAANLDLRPRRIEGAVGVEAAAMAAAIVMAATIAVLRPAAASA